MVKTHQISRCSRFVKVLTLLFTLAFSSSWGQTTIFSENMGNPGGTTSIAANIFQNNSPIVFSGTGDVRATTASSGYAGSSGNGNVFLTTGGTINFQIAGINTSACSSMTLTFGVFKSTTTSNGSELTVSTSTDGTTYNNLTMPALPTGAGTAAWSLATITSGIPSTTNLRIRFTNTSVSAVQFRIDDVKLIGSCTVCAAPSTTITPTTQTICAGSVTSFSISDNAASTPTPSYQWQMCATSAGTYSNVVNGTPAGTTYTGATTNSLSITAGSSYFYRCLVTDNTTTCTATSATSTLVVNTSPTITTQPVNKTICSGSNTSFTVAASGSPLTYQWQEKVGAGAFANIINGGVYSGATAATLVLTNPGTGMSTNQYQCIVSVASCSSVTTTAAVLTINTTPAAPPAPTAPSNPACTTGTLSAMSSTIAGVTWYWQGSVSTASVTTQSTATNYTFSASNIYYVRALDASGTCWSTTSSLSVTVNTPITITTQPTDKNICTGSNTSMVIAGAGTNPKQWQVSTDNGATFNNVVVDAVNSGVTLATLSLTNPPLSYNSYVYQCVVTVPGCAVVTSTTATLTVIQTPSAPPTPTALANPACSSTSLAAMSSTVVGVTWYWQGTTAAGSSTTSPTSSSYNVSASGTYYVRARTDGSSCLSATSSNIVVTVNTPPSVTSNPIDRTQCVGTNTTFVVAATGSGLTYQWQVNTGSGFANLTNVAPYSNVTTTTMSITSITAGMNGYLYQCVVNGSSPCAAVTSSAATLYITASSAPSVAATSPVTNGIACNAFNLSWTNGNGSNRLVVVKSGSAVAGNPVDGTSYTANTAFGLGSTIAAGEFVVYTGTGSSVFINGLSPLTTYYYMIFEFNGCSLNYLTSGTVPNGNGTTTSCASPVGATAVYVNACDGGCGFEGNNELVWGTTGSYALKVATNGPVLHYNTTTPPTTTYISSYGLYPSNVSALNTGVSSCTNTVFVDPNAQGYIPANTNFLIAHSCLCTPVSYDFSGLCNSGPIYVIFGTNAAWACGTSGGIFGNSGAGIRYFDLDFNAMGVNLAPIYSYSPNLLTNGGDGDVILLNPEGGPATYTNSACVVPLIVLPIELLDFYATKNGKINDLVWKVASEINVVYYTIAKSKDGVNFTDLVNVFTNYDEGSKTYTIIDDAPFDDITYYRLATKEKDGSVKYHKIIAVDEKSSEWNCYNYQQDQNLIIEFRNIVPKNSTVSLFDLSGKLLADETIKDSQTIINTQNFAEGVYFLRISTPYKTENFKLIISK